MKQFRRNGTYHRAYYYRFDHPSLNREKFISQYTDKPEIRQYLRNSKWPDTWPALSGIIADDENRLWVSTFSGNYNTFHWYVINEEGALLATFTWPARFFYRTARKRGGIRQVKDGFFYAYEEHPGDKDTQREGRFIRYRIELTKSNKTSHQ